MASYLHQLGTLYLLTFLHTTCSFVLPALNISSAGTPLLNASALGVVVPHCFDGPPKPQMTTVNITDCREVLRRLVIEPGFNEYIYFSRNHRRGVQVPRGWKARDCIVFVSCENDYDKDVFRYADVAQKANAVIDRCVKIGEGTPWGGVEAIGSIGSFYVSVTGRFDRIGTDFGNRTAGMDLD